MARRGGSLTSNRFKATLGALIALTFLGALLVSLVAFRNYRSSRDLIEPAQASPLLRHPELTGVALLRNMSFQSPDGLRLAGWYVPSKNHAAIVLTHGTNTDRSSMLPELRLLADAGFGVLAFDWPGLGDSEGEVLWDDSARHALTAAVDWLSAREDVDAQRIGGLGFSIGGFMMTQVAAGDRRLRAVVLEGTPTSFDAYLKLHHGRWGILGEWPARWAIRRSGLLAAAWAPQRLIAAIAPRSLLIIGGSRDEEIPAAMERELYSAAGEPKALWIVPGAQHGNYAQASPAEYPRRLLTFFSGDLVSAGGTIP